MIYKNAARVIALAAFLFAVPANAQYEEGIGGTFYADCFPSDGAALTMVLDNHLRITTFGETIKVEDAYRTKAERFTEEEPTTMYVSLCDDKMGNCRDIEAVLSPHNVDADTIEASIEYFDGTETQGDSESIQGHMASFTAKRDTKRPPAKCN